MNYKDLFQRSVMLLSAPAKAWEKIREEDGQHLQASFVYPMIALCGLSMFVGILFGNGVEDFNLQLVLTECSGIFISLFGGFFLASYLISLCGERFWGRPADDRENCQKLVGYSMVVIFVLDILMGLFPSFFVLRWILQFYLVYIVWEGAKVLMEIAEEKMLSYTLVASIIILASPAMIDFVFGQLSKMVN
ncbi:MAG: DUF1282 family protein [Bacteroidaceae bacterium]|nr:DUF1282 family protein [Bacteroidaceae bacterium]